MKRVSVLFFCSFLVACGEKPVAAPTMPLPVILPANYQWLTPAQVAALRTRTPDLGVLDVRDDSEMRDGNGWIAGAVPCSLFGGNEEKLQRLDRARPWLVYCALGGRAELTAQSMAGMGFENVYLLKGGFTAWQAAMLPVVK